MRVKVNGVYMNAPDGLDPDALAEWADRQPARAPGPPDTGGPVMAAARAPVPPSNVIPLPPPRPVEDTAPYPLQTPGAYAAQGSKSGWILPSQDNPAWKTGLSRPGTPPPPTSVAPQPQAAAAPSSAVTTAPLPAVTPPVSPVSPATPAATAPTAPTAPGATPPKTVKLNGVPIPLPPDWQKMTPDEQAVWADQVAAPSTLPEVMRNKGLPASPPIPQELYRDPVSNLLPPAPANPFKPPPPEPSVLPDVLAHGRDVQFKPPEALYEDPVSHLLPPRGKSEWVPPQPAPGPPPGTPDESSAGQDLQIGYLRALTGWDAQRATGALINRDRLTKTLAELQQKEIDAKAQGYPAGFNYKPQIEHAQRVLADLNRTITTAIGGVAKNTTGAEAIPSNPSAQRFVQSKTWGDAFSNFLEDPYGVSRSLVLQGLPAAAPALGAGLGGGLIGGPGGAAVGMGIVGGASTVGTEAMNLLQRFGADPKDPESVKKVFAEHADEITSDLTKRALIVGGVDAATGLVTSLLGRGMIGKPLADKMLRVAGGAGVNVAGGAGGEAGAELAEGQELHPGTIAGAGLSAIPGTLLEAVGAGRQRLRETAETPVQRFVRQARETDPNRPSPAVEEFIRQADAARQKPAAKSADPYHPSNFYGTEGEPPPEQPPQRLALPAPGTEAAEAPPPGQPVTPTEPAPPPPGAAPAGRPPTPGAALPLHAGVDTSHWSPRMQETFSGVQQQMVESGIDQAQVTSAFRSPEHNRAVGGASQSTHMHGDATDISLAGLTPEQQQRTIDIVLAQPGVTGFGFYPNSNSIHFDVGHEKKAAWGQNYSQSSIGENWPTWMTEKVNAWRGQPTTAQPVGGAATPVGTAGAAIPGQAPGQPGQVPTRLTNPAHEQAIRDAATSAGLDPDTLVRIAQIESGGDASAQNKTSSAGGLFQFTDATWKEFGQGDRMDPAANIAAMARLTRSNIDALSKGLGRAPEPWEIYMAHQQGAGGALKILAGDGSQNAAAVLGADAVINNGGTRAMTLDQFREAWQSRFNAARGSSSTLPAGASTLPGGAAGGIEATPAAAPGAGSGTVEGGAPAQSSPSEPAFLPASGQTVTSATQPETNTLTTDAGEIQTKPMVVDLTDIMHSGQPGYDQALQPRDRDRAASQAQVASIAGNLDPRRITALGPESDRGPPIINSQGMVESGNGRVMALQQAYARGLPGGQAYRDHLTSLGYDVSKMTAPVLVQQRMTPLQPQQVQQFVQGANRPTALTMGATEQAVADARRITPDMTSMLAQGRDPATNSNFRRAFMKGLSQTEQGAMLDPDGNLSAQGQTRIRNAVLAAGYGDSPALQRAIESTDDNTKALSAALMEAAPEMAQVRKAVEEGRLEPAFDQTKEITDAVNRISQIRETGQKLESYLSQQDAFNPIPPDVEAWMRMFYDDKLARQLSKERIATALRNYADEALKTEGQGSGLDLGLPAVTPTQLRAQAREKAVGRQGGEGQGGLFGSGEGRADVSADSAAPRRPADRAPSRRQEPDEVGAGSTDQASDRAADRAPGRGKAADAVEKVDDEATTEAVRSAAQDKADAYDKAAWTQRLSRYEDVFVAAGHDPAEVAVMPPERQFAIAAKQTKEAFGFHTIEKTPKALTRHAIDQLKDIYRNAGHMAFALNIPQSAVGLNGHFGVTLRRMGRGDDAYYGAYYPSRRSAMEGLGQSSDPNIVLPERTNSFGHEWAHALDYWIGEKLGVAKGPKSFQEYVKSLKDRTKLGQGNLWTPELADVAGAMARVYEAMFIDPATGQPTTFALESVGYGYKSNGLKGAKYYGSAREMFARAFETYLSERVRQNGGGFEALTKDSGLYGSSADERFLNTFPKEEERTRIFAALDALMGAVSTVPEIVGLGHTTPMGEATHSADAWASAHMGGRVPNIGEALKRDGRYIQRYAKAMADATAMAWKQGPKVLAQKAGKGMWTVIRENATHSMKSQLEAVAGRLNADLAERGRPESTSVRKFIDTFASTPGSTRVTGETFLEAKDTHNRVYRNELTRILTNHGWDDATYTDAVAARIRDLLVTSGKTGLEAGEFKRIGASRQEIETAGDMRRLLDKLWYYANEAGLDINYTRNGYLPRVYLDDKIEADTSGFVKKATEVYKHVFDRDVSRSQDWLLRQEIDGESWDDFMDTARAAAKAKKIDPKDYKKLVAARRNVRDDDNPVTRAELEDKLDAVYDAVRNHFGKSSAEAWSHQILNPTLTPGVDHAKPPMKFKKKRALPPIADEILKDYMETDPITLIGRYTHQIVQSTESHRFFGAGNEKMEALLTAMKAEGLTTNDQDLLRKYFNRMSGQEKKGSWSGGRLEQAVDTLNMIGTAGLLVVTTFNNLAESSAIGLRTLRVGDVGKGQAMVSQAAADRIARWFGGEGSTTVQYWDGMSQMLGIITDTGADHLISDRLARSDVPGTWANRKVQRMYENVGIASLTRWQRAMAVRAGVPFFREMGSRLLVNPEDQMANLFFAEMGIPEEERAGMAAWLNRHFPADGPATPLDELANDPHLERFRTAMGRFADQTIQEPKSVNKPYHSGTPVIRNIYGLLSFGYAMHEHLIMPIIRKLGKQGGLTGQRKAQVLASAAGVLLSLAAVHAMFALFRSFALDSEDRKKKTMNGFAQVMSGNWSDPDAGAFMITVLSRMGILHIAEGPTVVALNKAWGTEAGGRYDPSVPKTLLGPAIGNIADQATRILGVFSARNSPNTTTAEFRAAQGAYTLAAQLAMPIILGSMPVGGALQVFGAGAATALRSGTVRDKLISGATGYNIPGTPEDKAAKSAATKARHATPEYKAEKAAKKAEKDGAKFKGGLPTYK